MQQNTWPILSTQQTVAVHFTTHFSEFLHLHKGTGVPTYGVVTGRNDSRLITMFATSQVLGSVSYTIPHQSTHSFPNIPSPSTPEPLIKLFSLPERLPSRDHSPTPGLPSTPHPSLSSPRALYLFISYCCRPVRACAPVGHKVGVSQQALQLLSKAVPTVGT